MTTHPEQRPPETVIPAQGALRVLVACGDAATCQSIAEQLASTFTTVVATSEDGAYRLALDQAIALLVIAREGELDGEQLLGRLRGEPRMAAVPVLWLVEQADINLRTRLLQPGLGDYLLQPFSSQELMGRAHNLIALRHSQQQLAQQVEEYSQERVAQLIASETNFRLMVDSIEDYAMFMVDLGGRITSWNRGAERLTGYSEAEALGQPFSMLYPREDLDESHAAYELAMAQRHGRHEEEGLRVRKDGSTYAAQILIWRVDDEHGKTRGFAKITRDVTARRQAEQALKESEAKFRSIADAMPQMVWSTQPNGFHDYFNQQWYRFTGLPEGSTDGDGWNDVFHPEDQPGAWKAWRYSLSTGEPYEIQYRLRHHSGHYRWTLGRALPVRDESGTIVRWMGTCTDIHDQKLAEQALQESSRRKDEFLAMLAHELRNPLAPIQNSALLIRKLAPEQPGLINALNVIDRQVRHMTRLVEDLLDVARISRGKIQLRKEPCELGEIVAQTIEDYRSSFESARVQLQLRPADTRLWVEGDHTRIAQMVGNLLHNALKFTAAGGRVTVSVSCRETAQGTRAEIEVRDTGVGIEPALAANLFNPFIQAGQGLARSQGGLGLGLALVKGFAELHGGSVDVESDGLGCGAAFIVQLPLAAEKAGLGGAVDMAEAASRLRIVLIDDNHDMVDTFKTLLSIGGHEVTAAYDGVSGIETIRATRPDLVICDIGLPGETDGYAVARAVRADPDLAPVFLVALTGYGQDEDRRRAQASGFDLHLLKPINFEELDKVFAAVSRATG